MPNFGLRNESTINSRRHNGQLSENIRRFRQSGVRLNHDQLKIGHVLAVDGDLDKGDVGIGMTAGMDNASAIAMNNQRVGSESAASIYRGLMRQFAELDRSKNADVNHAADESTHGFLLTQLRLVESIEVDIPDNPRHLVHWLAQNVKNIGEQYHSYIAARDAGAPRRFFSTRSHALHFLRAVAPTKMVDGAWLYGLLNQWPDPYLAPFIDIYLDELGQGNADQNHVLLYRRLLAYEGINTELPLSDAHFIQGAIQLALARHVKEFLPEIIGFNLGYEQLPLHLLISAYELAELGIDPYYFTLHVTIDNFDSGHAQKSLQGALALIPKLDDDGEFYQRLINGYKLNSLGLSTAQIIAQFSADEEVLLMLRHKSELGRFMHADNIRIEERTVNEWLSAPQQIGDFIAALIRAGWIKRNQDPNRSRFWRMIAASNGVMAGVFNRAEQRLIYDWICGDWQAGKNEILNVGRISRQRAARTDSSDINNDVQRLQQQLNQFDEPAAKLDSLVPYLSPSLHYTPIGLAATRLFCELLPS